MTYKVITVCYLSVLLCVIWLTSVLFTCIGSCSSESTATELDSSQETEGSGADVSGVDSGGSSEDDKETADMEVKEMENVSGNAAVLDHPQLTEQRKSLDSPRKPRLKYKSMSLPEEDSQDPPTPRATQDSMAPPTDSTSMLHPSPTSHRRRSVPPVTPPGISPAVSRKKLIYTQRPLSKLIIM